MSIDPTNLDPLGVKGFTPGGKAEGFAIQDFGTGAGGLKVVTVDTSGNYVSGGGGTFTSNPFAFIDFVANASGTGYASGDFISRITIVTAPTTSTSYWVNQTQNTILSTPPTISTLTALPSSISINGKTATVLVTPIITAGAYATANLDVGGKLIFANAVGAQLSGSLQSVRITNKNNAVTGFQFYLFGTNPTNSTWTDHTAPSIQAGDLPFLITDVNLPSANTTLNAATSFYVQDAIGAQFNATTTSLYGILIATGTPTFTTTTDITIAITIAQD